MAKYIKYTIKNIEPLRIGDDNTSLRGQTITLRYIPGSSIRGYVINKLAKQSDFEDIKVELFRDGTCFMNAYLSVDGKELIPSPKGFYEDKTGDGQIETVLKDGKITEGKKRAALGRYCYFEENTIYYYSVETESDMKITIGNEKKDIEQNVFRNEYISRGNYFTGYIKTENEELCSRIKETFEQLICIGNAKSQGFGKCEVVAVEVMEEIPFQNLVSEQIDSGQGLKGACYLYLLSNTVMRDRNGNYVGIDCSKLEEKLGVTDLTVEFCSTSIVEVKGYNRQWKSMVQSVNMYEQGSIFKLKYTGEITYDKILKLMDEGVGVRRNEGYGRVLFFREVAKYTRKIAGECEKLGTSTIVKQKEDQAVLKLVAKGYYIQLLQEKKQECLVQGKDVIKGAKAAHVRALISANKYNSDEAVRVIKEYFKHEAEKEQKQNIQKKKDSIVSIQNKIFRILDSEFETIIGMDKRDAVMGIKVKDLMSQQDYRKLQLDYIIKCIRIENRKEAQ